MKVERFLDFLQNVRFKQIKYMDMDLSERSNRNLKTYSGLLSEDRSWSSILASLRFCSGLEPVNFSGDKSCSEVSNIVASGELDITGLHSSEPIKLNN